MSEPMSDNDRIFKLQAELAAIRRKLAIVEKALKEYATIERRYWPQLRIARDALDAMKGGG